MYCTSPDTDLSFNQKIDAGSVVYPPTNFSLITSHRTSWTNPHLFWIGHTIHTHLGEAGPARIGTYRGSGTSLPQQRVLL